MNTNRHFITKKTTAFWLIVAIGLAYLAALVLMSVRILPVALTQLRLIIDVVATRCSPQVLWGSADGSVSLVLAAVVMALWLKTAIAAARAVLTIVRTRGFVKTLTDVHLLEQGMYSFHSPQAQAFTAGLLHPQIYISDMTLQKCSHAELQSVICHEREHQRVHDTLRKLMIQVVRGAMPYFPFKQAIIANYEVLSELSADEYAESVQLTKRSIISALHKMMDVNKSDYAVSGFGACSDRISILVGKEEFKTRQYFSMILVAAVFVSLNAMFLGQTGNQLSAGEYMSRAVVQQRGSYCDVDSIVLTSPEESAPVHSTPDKSSHNSF